eukprot:365855-Chlamydomonas_euryale.AAC.6
MAVYGFWTIQAQALALLTNVPQQILHAHQEKRICTPTLTVPWGEAADAAQSRCCCRPNQTWSCISWGSQLYSRACPPPMALVQRQGYEHVNIHQSSKMARQPAARPFQLYFLDRGDQRVAVLRATRRSVKFMVWGTYGCIAAGADAGAAAAGAIGPGSPVPNLATAASTGVRADGRCVPLQTCGAGPAAALRAAVAVAADVPLLAVQAAAPASPAVRRSRGKFRASPSTQPGAAARAARVLASGRPPLVTAAAARQHVSRRCLCPAPPQTQRSAAPQRCEPRRQPQPPRHRPGSVAPRYRWRCGDPLGGGASAACPSARRRGAARAARAARALVALAALVARHRRRRP